MARRATSFDDYATMPEIRAYGETLTAHELSKDNLASAFLRISYAAIIASHAKEQALKVSAIIGSIASIAEMSGISTKSVERDFTIARKWLAKGYEMPGYDAETLSADASDLAKKMANVGSTTNKLYAALSGKTAKKEKPDGVTILNNMVKRIRKLLVEKLATEKEVASFQESITRLMGDDARKELVKERRETNLALERQKAERAKEEKRLSALVVKSAKDLARANARKEKAKQRNAARIEQAQALDRLDELKAG